MNITKIKDHQREVCEKSYYEWFQNNHPTFGDLLKKVKEECGCHKSEIVYNPIDTSKEEYSLSIHSILITIEKHNKSHSMEIKTHMKGLSGVQEAKSDWTDYPRIDELYIPYFNLFLSQLRKVWYEQKKYNSPPKTS